ncbi:MAG: toxin-activating lysine-acyltransferase, partial [Natronospirillum sp.]
MQRAFHSPLPALNHENRVGEPLPLWHAIGVVSHLMLEHPDYRGLNVATVFNLIFQQLKRCQGEIFLDEQQRPIGYASWLIVDKQVHDQLMSESINADSLLESAVNLRQDAYLWFLDLITPFSTSLPILRQLREQ